MNRLLTLIAAAGERAETELTDNPERLIPLVQAWAERGVESLADYLALESTLPDEEAFRTITGLLFIGIERLINNWRERGLTPDIPRVS